ncbi:MAG: cysteine synthase A [Myxococcales bacterium]|nr:MAG: cysteine synthase A [Myxococcales bacterium]
MSSDALHVKAPVVQSVLELIGNSPLMHIRHVQSPEAGAVWAKTEYFNPGGSVKDRICLAMLEQAERDGIIKKGSTIVEPTSGNTGIGLAVVCAVKGYKLVLTMPESMSLERRALLEAYGAEIVLTQAERVMQGAIEAAHDIVKTRGAFMPMQFDNEANPESHAKSTAQEIISAMEDQSIDAFVSAVGTGGTISGVGRVFKKLYPSCKIIAVEPESSPVLSGGEAGPTKIQGIGAGFIPENFDSDVVDDVRLVSDRLAYETKKKLALEEGLLVGISAGANVAIAAEVARELGPGKNVITVLCDTGERYFSLDNYFAS